ncbi:MAG: nascent polypeptide-associated complex protein [Methanomicrobiales archaeon]|nr:nascent polypeptide-associated complex protein [Methanomicrobiales archaeon]
MFPGRINPKKMKQMMKQMGMEMQQLDGVQKVEITTASGTYIFDTAEVVEMIVQGVRTYQITGEPRFEPAAAVISKEDVDLVREQSGAGEEEARAALAETQGDIAGAILKLTRHD